MSAVHRLQAVEDLSGEYAALESQIDQADGDTIVFRWEFGGKLLAEREAAGGNQLPRGRIAEICAEVGKTRSGFEREIQWRLKAAKRYPTRAELRTAVRTFGSWTALRESLQAEETARRKRAQQLSRQFDVEMREYNAYDAPRARTPNYLWFAWVKEQQRVADRYRRLPTPSNPDSFFRREAPKLARQLRRRADELDALAAEFPQESRR